MSTEKVIEKFGLYFDEIGLNKTYGRMFGLFMTVKEPISMGKLVAELKISKSTASVEIRRLLKMGYLEKVLLPDQRADFYQLKKNIWITHFFQKMQMIKNLHSILEEISPKELEGCKNLKEMGDYCAFMEVELKHLADKYMKTMKREDSGSYKEPEFIIEWCKLPALSEAFHEKMQSLADLGISTFREIELEFLKAYESGAEEAINEKLKKIFCTHPNELSSEWRAAMKDVYYYVVTIREENSKSPQGVITFMTGGFIPNDEFKITILAVDKTLRRKGAGSLLVNSLKRIGVHPKKILASTRPSNKAALAAFQKWRFHEDAEAAKSAPSHFVPGHWVHLVRYE